MGISKATALAISRPICVSGFPDLFSQSPFVALMSRFVYLTCGYGCCTDLGFIDSTFLAVCYHRRISRPRICAGIALRG